MKRLLAAVAIIALGLIAPTFTHADAILNFSDPQVVGTITPGAPAAPADVSDYIDLLITLTLNQTVTHDFGQPEGTQIETRSNNTFGSLPTVIFVNSSSNQGTSTTVNVGAVGDTYLFAKYDGQNDQSLVWDIAGLTGTITIPQNGPDGHGLSGWILFNPTSRLTTPEPSSLMLLGTGALGLWGPIRRKLRPRWK